MKILTILFFVIFVFGCSSSSIIEHYDHVLSKNGMVRYEYEQGDFGVAYFLKETLDKRNETIHIYIEGDGRAWLNKFSISDNPTPFNSVVVKMALDDTNHNVAIIGRPCQYFNLYRDGWCNNEYWSYSRYSDEVVNAISEVIDEILQKLEGEKQVGLIGFSGGGTIASLVAPRRDDVSWLITVAANLDHKLWTEIHGVTPLTNSMNLLEVTDQLEVVPQVHFVGSNDTVVPKDVVLSLVDKYDTIVPVITVEGFSHQCCWGQDWKILLKQALERLE